MVVSAQCGPSTEVTSRDGWSDGTGRVNNDGKLGDRGYFRVNENAL